MRGIGVIEDGFTFTEAELARGTPRFWWNARKAAAYERAIARRGMARPAHDDRDGGSSMDDWHRAPASVTAAGAATVIADAVEDRRPQDAGHSHGGAETGSSSDSGGGSGE